MSIDYALAKTVEAYDREARLVLMDSLKIDSEEVDPEVVSKRMKMLSLLHGVEHHFRADVDPIEETDLELFLSMLNQKPGNILNIGCGLGKEAKFFLESGYDTVMIDSSKTMAQLASANTNHEVHCCDFLNFRSDNTFDGIYADGVFHHYSWNNMHKALDKCEELLSPEGILLFTVREGSEDFTAKSGKYYQCYTFDILYSTMQINNPDFKLINFSIKQSEENFSTLQLIFEKRN